MYLPVFTSSSRVSQAYPSILVTLDGHVSQYPLYANTTSCFHPSTVLAALASTDVTDTGTATLDSGANRYFTPHKHDFVTYKTMSASVILASGTPQTLIHGQGWVRKQLRSTSGTIHTLLLPAYFAPSFHTDLVGVATLNDAKVGCTLDPHSTHLTMPNGDRVPITRTAKGLFVFTWHNANLTEQTVTAQSVVAIPPDVLHQRLGHPSDRSIVCMRREESVDNMPGRSDQPRSFCEACALSKSTAAAVPRTPTRHDDDKLFGTVFIDFKTIETPGIGGYKYVLGFACRYRQTKVWVYPTSHRQIMVAVHQFETVVAQYSPNEGVSCYRSDGALENTCKEQSVTALSRHLRSSQATNLTSVTCACLVAMHICTDQHIYASLLTALHVVSFM